MRAFVFFSSIALSVSLISGCSTSVEKPRPMDFGVVISGDSQQFQSVSTFAWHDRSGTVIAKDKQRAQEASQLYHALVEQVMIDKGYRLVSRPLEADVLLAVAIAQQSEMTDSDIFVKTMLSTGILPVDEAGEAVEKGSLYVAAFSTKAALQDNRTQPMWRALAQRPLKDDVDEETRLSLATDLVKRMMNSIPTSHQ
ncbi:DUF4136 domain-containing protein [uncultured Vibrio sp.]|uniref:DUF4136 domain-containing protein n=1 Tax=uncultured Vibrio sp. TaxID=114054 RepID=UPI0025D0C53A|nr:DUF4136 domain-containing protein [uncultured Vibrio sp.]